MPLHNLLANLIVKSPFASEFTNTLAIGVCAEATRVLQLAPKFGGKKIPLTLQFVPWF